jgi:ATP-dependent Clp protease ATP-binding subunit ClpA
MENFTNGLNDRITDAIKFLITKRQNELKIHHVLYVFLNNLPDIKEISSIIDKEKILSKLNNEIDNMKISKEVPDLDDNLKDIIKNCHIYCSAIGKEKIGEFDFFKVSLESEVMSSFIKKNKIKFNLEILENIFKIINSEIKIVVKKKRRLETSLPKSNLINNVFSSDKNDVSNYLNNLNEKITSDFIYEDYDNKIDEVIKVLLRKEKSNPLILGKAGVGKTALIEGLAKRIVDKKVPEKILNKKIYELNLSSLLAGTNFRGDFEKRFENIIKFIKENKNIILFIDEIHCLKGLGAATKDDLDLSNMLKPYLSSGEISCIGTTTFEEYKNTIGSDKALNRRFEIITVEEPSKEKTIKLLKNKKKVYENFHQISVDDKIIETIVNLSDRFITKGSFPDKAFDILDLSCSLAEMENKTILDNNMVIKNIEKVSGISYEQIIGYDKIVLSLENKMKESIFGQDKQLKEICDKIIVSKSGLSNPNKPLASFLLIGSTGVGKTEIVNQLSKELAMKTLRLDMSEFSEKGSVSRLIGTSAGYVGFEEGGQLTEFVFHNPYSVILFDEIEKADKSVLNLFLQILDYGKLTDGSGKVIDFRNTIIFMTSNAGAENLNSNSIGIVSEKGFNFDKAVNSTFSPEFRNRISKIIVFNSLDSDSMEKLVNKNLLILQEKLKEKNIEIKFSEKVKEIIIKNGFNPKLGARPLERYIEDNISYLIAKLMIESKIKDSIYIDYKENMFIVE